MKSGMVSRLRNADRKNMVVGLAVAAILLNGVFNHLRSSANGPSALLAPGNQLPAFSIKLADGQTVSNRDIAGRPAVFFFFADWCPCAHLSVKFLKRVSGENSPKQLAVLGVGMQDKQSHYVDFAAKHKLAFPVATGGGDAMADSIGVRTTPSLVFVDASGIIRFYFIGKVERYDQIENGLNRLAENTHSPLPG